MSESATNVVSVNGMLVTFVQGTKSGANFHPGSYISTVVNVNSGESLGSYDSSKYSSIAYGLNAGELASIGFLTTAPTTITYSCSHSDLAALSASNDLRAASVPIPAGTATTFTVTGSGKSSCAAPSTPSTSGTTTSSFGLSLQLTPLALFAAHLVAWGLL